MEARSGFREAGWEASLYVSCKNDDARLHKARVRSAARAPSLSTQQHFFAPHASGITFFFFFFARSACAATHAVGLL